ncbi:MAG: FAD-binding oxidoreductase [Gemmatimonadetes bacterium]|nr:FAD-binding oxidoreductase [Gemmatimonadota bacterium]
MASLRIRTSSGDETTLDPASLEQLAGGLRGELLTPDTPGYDEARSIWNAMIDRRPALIARCAEASDVLRAVRFAREHDLLLAVRGGGHNIAGNAVCDGGLMVSLAAMRSVGIDARGRTARVEGGATLGDFDRKAQAFGLATPLGINSTTGVAGLTLGGGFGWLSRKYGLTIDNLLSVDVVNAEGELLEASELENQDLFWGVRGGGGNLGVITSFEFRLHPVGPEILSGLVVHPFEDAPAVLRHYRDFVAEVPDELAVWLVLRKAPPLPFLPQEWHGKEVVILAAFCAGDMREGERALEPLRRFGRPIADVIGPHPYVAWQQAFDPLLTPGARNYWKSHNFTWLDDGLFDALVDYAGRLPSPQCEIFIGQLGGATSRVPPEAMAYAQRDVAFVLNVHGRWEQPAQDEVCMGWAREFFQTTAPFATGGVYVNFLTQEETARVRAAYGPNYDRLAELKQKYDPDNLFRLNQNIRPAIPA